MTPTSAQAILTQAFAPWINALDITVASIDQTHAHLSMLAGRSGRYHALPRRGRETGAQPLFLSGHDHRGCQRQTDCLGHRHADAALTALHHHDVVGRCDNPNAHQGYETEYCWNDNFCHCSLLLSCPSF